MPIHIYQADCINVLPVLTSVDAVIIDPPFGTGTRKWDKEPAQAVWSELLRLCPDGPIAIFGYAKQLFRWSRYLDELQLIGFVVWHCYNAPLVSPGLTRVHQGIAIFGKSLKQVKAHAVREPYSDDDSLISLYNVPSCVTNDNLKKRLLESGRKKRHLDGRRCSDLWSIPAPGAGFNSYQRLHPNQKPLEVMRRLVLLLTDEGQTVLDCYMGSGTTGVACIATNRDFIGIDNDPDYFKIAQDRLSQAQMERQGEWHIRRKRGKHTQVNDAQLTFLNTA